MILDFSAFPCATCSSRRSVGQVRHSHAEAKALSPPALTPFLSEWTKTRPSTPSAKRTPRGRSTATKYSLSRIAPAGPLAPGSAPSAAAAATLSLLHLRPLMQETEVELCARALGGARGPAHPAPPRRPRAAAVAVMVRAGGVRRCRWGAMGAARDGDRVRGGGERNGGHGIRSGVEWGCGDGKCVERNRNWEAEAFGSLLGLAGRGGSGTHAALFFPPPRSGSSLTRGPAPRELHVTWRSSERYRFSSFLGKALFCSLLGCV